MLMMRWFENIICRHLILILDIGQYCVNDEMVRKI